MNILKVCSYICFIFFALPILGVTFGIEIFGYIILFLIYGVGPFLFVPIILMSMLAIFFGFLDGINIIRRGLNQIKKMNCKRNAYKPLSFVVDEIAAGKTVYPSNGNIFRALELTPIKNVKVLILGQDPYHGEGQAHGLAFSVQKGVRVPPSLKNIYKELQNDTGMTPPNHGFLEGWAQQGILLLNTTLTVEHGKPASHQGKGWEEFTDSIIQQVNDKKDPVVFMLWGAHAGKKASMIDANKHLVLTAPHPSPLSAHRGFLGCGHFSKANEFLRQNEQNQINWSDL
jgi:uracil-DNA glycosylase